MHKDSIASEEDRASTLERRGTWALAVAIAVVGGFAWWIQTRSALLVDASLLARLPGSVASWSSREVPLDSTVEAVLRADFNVQRAYYRGSDRHPVWVYVGYYGTARGGRPEHTPRYCYTAAGWDILSARTLRAEDGSGRRLNEYLVGRGGDERRLVHFWYRSSRRSGMVGGLDQTLDQALGRLRDGRADGALVRVSTILGPDGEEGARRRLFSLGGTLDRQLEEHWPSELPSKRG